MSIKKDKYDKQITKVIKVLGSDKIQCLRNLFDELQGTPPQVNKVKYRANHPEEMDILDSLDYTERWIEHDKSHVFYLISPYALPLVKSKKSENLIEMMECFFQILKKLYPEKLKESVTVDEICEQSNYEREDALDALYYLSNISGIWSGKSNGFPYEENSTLAINEHVLRKDSLFEVYKEHFKHCGVLHKSHPPTQDISSSSLASQIISKFKQHPIISVISALTFFIITLYALTEAFLGFYNLLKSFF
tara:strand:- start:7813 stop:8559 length:747 start_codon:yes stop_codon:yes gene_type:complete